jgi:hypothetical protein
LAQYSSVNAAANQTAQTPFQTYSGEFVAPVNSEQSAGISGTNTYADAAQPYYGAATGVLGDSQAGTTGVNQAAEGLAAGSTNLSGQDIQKYMSPYLSDVVGSEANVLNQNNQQQQAGQLGDAITSGAFGSDRTGIAAANLEEQQNLANSQIYSGLLNSGYNTALGTATTEQGVQQSAASELANIGSTQYGEGANTASELGTLGTNAQSAGLAGSQAQIAAGTVQQQTQQAQDTAEYNQFLQQQSYPFQVDEFLASIAEGTGALSGSTTTTTQPGGFFSDEHLKDDMEPVGKTFDGQTIYRYKLKGDPRERIGLSAQQVEKKHPDAVGLAGGFRWVDYGKATDAAANRGHMYSGGVAGRGEYPRRMYAYGGAPDGGLDSVLSAQQNMYSNRGQQQQRNIAPQGGVAGGHQLAVASGTPAPPQSGASGVQQAVGLGKDAYQGYKWMTKPSSTPSQPSTATNLHPGVQQNAAQVGLQPDTSPPSGLTTNFEADPTAGTTTTFPDYSAGLNTSASPGVATPGTSGAGLAGADSGAASSAGSGAAGAASTEAAGAGAAETAGAGAAAEAGAGVAAGAAAEGAVDAGAADAAASIAAEYAAADVAAAAVMAAKRGGAIRRKYDAGGMPYSDPDDELDIPDQQTAGKLQTAGPIQKQPTGLQTAMKMGDPNQWEGMASGMFSNTALATGGVAGRRGYDDGGSPSDDGDASSDSAPVIATDSERGAGVVNDEPKSSLWNTIKKHATAENVIPILSGLTAMGTARTRSPGVALAAGLGAGSQSYLDTRSSLAQTAEEQQKAKGAGIANQLAAMKVQAAKDYLTPGASSSPYSAPTSAQNAPSSPASPTAGAIAANKIDQQYRNQFYTPPWLPNEQQALQKARGAAIALGTDQPVQQAQAVRDQRYQNQLAANKNAAQAEADRLYGVATDPNTDPSHKQAAVAAYNAVHQWTGDDWIDKEGVRVNSRTGAPAIGVAKQTLAPSADPVTDSFGNQFILDKQTNTLKPVGSGRGSARPSKSATSSSQTSDSGPTFHQAVADQPHILQDIEGTRANTDVIAPTNRNINQHLLELSAQTASGPATQTIQKIAGAVGLPSGSRYQEIDAYLNRQAALSASAMGVPHTNAGLAASQSATGTTEYTPQALQEKVKFADALNSGAMAYRQGLDKSIGTGSTPDLSKYQTFRSAWSRNFDPDVFRAEDAIRRGDAEELAALKQRLGVRGMATLAQKSANLRALENGQIPQ